MAMISAKCPNCGANIEVDDVRDSFYCSYCGSQIQRDPTNTFTLRTVDVAKIKEIESNERIKEKEIEQQRADLKDSSRRMIRFVLLTIVLVILMILPMKLEENAQKKEEQRLQSIVVEIQEDISNGDYDNALIKANTLYMPESSLSNRDKAIAKWNQQREELIRLIKEKKEEASKN